jgi:hypothetical protein
MKLINTEKQSVEILLQEKKVKIKSEGKTYTFPYQSIVIKTALSSCHYTWFLFELDNVLVAYDGRKRVTSYLCIGVNELYNTVTLNAVFIRKLKKRNKPVFLKGEFKGKKGFLNCFE